jgi:hypothetical protein
MGDGAQIYLAKPGSQREGPYTVEQLRQGLAARKFQDNAYWAWREGMPGWVPLYELPEISGDGPSAAPAAAEPQAEQPKETASEEVASGLPYSALERIFLFTTGDGPAAWNAPAVSQMLEASVGTKIDTIRNEVPRDVVGQCVVGELLKPDGSLSDAAWRAMASHQPDLVQQARQRLLRVCIRTFDIEPGTVAALALFYNKQKL